MKPGIWSRHEFEAVLLGFAAFYAALFLGAAWLMGAF